MGELNYGRMMHRAMQGLVAEALSVVAEHGLPGAHHFYITFVTSHPGVDIPDWLRADFPDEITIVLQYEFRDLAVTSDRFSVRLSFNDRPATIVVPFDAILQFADPSAEFGLRFDPSIAEDSEDDDDDEVEEEEGLEAEEPPSTLSPEDLKRHAASARADDEAPKRPGEVVSLDQFRKK